MHIKTNQMKKFSQIGKIHEGKLDLNRAEFSEGLRELGDGSVLISVEKIAKNRSAMQNAYYWGVILPKIAKGFISNGTKLNPKDSEHLNLVHLFLKKRILGEVTVEIANAISGEVETVAKISRSRDLNKGEFESYLHECRSFALEYFYVTIPLPNE